LEGQLKSFPASRQYKSHFENFLTANKINIEDYDAVIGYEYRLGGKQMCIPYKNKQPSPFQEKLRLLFVPIGPMATPKSPPGTKPPATASFSLAATGSGAGVSVRCSSYVHCVYFKPAGHRADVEVAWAVRNVALSRWSRQHDDTLHSESGFD
jgi:hypothetical protein